MKTRVFPPPWRLSRLLALAACVAPHGQCSLVLNGDFEDPVVTADRGWVNYADGMSFPGWTVDSGSVDIVRIVIPDYGDAWSAASGAQSVDLNGYGPGSIYQDLNTVPGATYYLSFAMAGNVVGGQLIVTMEFAWAGGVVNTLTFDVADHNGYEVGWAYHQYAVVAPPGSTTTRLRFASLSDTGSRGPALDDVVVGNVPRPWIPVEGVTPVPELPTTWSGVSALGILLIGLGRSWTTRLRQIETIQARRGHYQSLRK